MATGGLDLQDRQALAYWSWPGGDQAEPRRGLSPGDALSESAKLTEAVDYSHQALPVRPRRTYRAVMAWLANLLEPVARWRQARRRELELVEAEAQALIAEKSREGALWGLRERIQLAHNNPKARRRLLALQEAVIRLAPRAYRADTATRMLYRQG